MILHEIWLMAISKAKSQSIPYLGSVYPIYASISYLNSAFLVEGGYYFN